MTDLPTWAAALAAPMPPEVVWDAVAVAPDRDALLLAPRLAVAAIRQRLDAVAGAARWGATLHALPGDAIACHLQIDGVTKAGVAAVNVAFDGAKAAERAFALAAVAFGIALPDGAAPAPRWVACDPSTLAFAEAPWSEGAPDGAREDAVTDAFDAVPEVVIPAASPHELPSGDSAALTLAPDEAAGKPEAQRIIDRLIERLREVGLGLSAARILVRHQGYGRDPASARELYAELRSLLLTARSDP